MCFIFCNGPKPAQSSIWFETLLMFYMMLHGRRWKSIGVLYLKCYAINLIHWVVNMAQYCVWDTYVYDLNGVIHFFPYILYTYVLFSIHFSIIATPSPSLSPSYIPLIPWYFCLILCSFDKKSVSFLQFVCGLLLNCYNVSPFNISNSHVVNIR